MGPRLRGNLRTRQAQGEAPPNAVRESFPTSLLVSPPCYDLGDMLGTQESLRPSRLCQPRTEHSHHHPLSTSRVEQRKKTVRLSRFSLPMSCSSSSRLNIKAKNYLYTKTNKSASATSASPLCFFAVPSPAAGVK